MDNDEELKVFRTAGDEFRQCIDIIMNSHSFRRLSGKTQIILSLTGPSVRTRLTHTVEVARIARDICLELKLNVELAEAIALAHDLGHTPFGHVGERTLKEIMCGCDTLDGKVRDFDFYNSGFKHNLQSFRVLNNIERVVDSKPEWPFIMWGVIDHTKPTYAEIGTAKDTEIYISCGHCKDVYNCYFDKKDHKCKRNKIDRFVYKDDAICKPWNCSDIKGQKNEHWTSTYCIEPCYLAKLWKYKKNNKSYENFIYLFDHPFPNSYYSTHFNDFFFNGTFKDCVSFEGQIVKQADEIAQRQEDLEDGLTKGLISRKEAKKQISELIAGFKDHAAIGKLFSELRSIGDEEPDFQTKMGTLLLKFYKRLLIHSTKNNIRNRFLPEKSSKEKISYYCLLDILNEINGDNKAEWLLKEMKSFSLIHKGKYQNTLNNNVSFYNRIFKKCFADINCHEVYFFFLILDYLQKEIKLRSREKIGNIIEISEKFKMLLCEKSRYKRRYNDLIKINGAKRKALGKNEAVLLIFDLDIIKDHFLKSYPNQYRHYKNRTTPWKNIIDLNLIVFHQVYSFMKSQRTKAIYTMNVKRKKVRNVNLPISSIYSQWRKNVKLKGNQVISNLINFLEIKGCKEKKECLTTFKNNQANTILKSEIVEKNDGKATFILKRLFEAYITNPHQLPDYSLRNILVSLITRKKEFIRVTSSTFKDLILLKEALVPYLEKNSNYSSTDLMTLSSDITKTLKLMMSYFFVVPEADIRSTIARLANDVVRKEVQEIVESLKEDNLLRGKRRNREKLNKLTKLIEIYVDYENKITSRGFPIEIKDLFQKRKSFDCFLYSISRRELLFNDDYARKQIRLFRGMIDNAVLNAIPLWKTILTRGICDYIAGLTDQEAIDEYEKLYAGIMELV